MRRPSAVQSRPVVRQLSEVTRRGSPPSMETTYTSDLNRSAKRTKATRLPSGEKRGMASPLLPLKGADVVGQAERAVVAIEVAGRHRRYLNAEVGAVVDRRAAGLEMEILVSRILEQRNRRRREALRTHTYLTLLQLLSMAIPVGAVLGVSLLLSRGWKKYLPI